MRQILKSSLLVMAGTSLLASCGTSGTSGNTQPPSVSRDCASGAIRIADNFEASAFETCTRTADAAFTFVIKPEDVPINDSAWYAFDILGAAGKKVDIKLAYLDGTHRYQPKLHEQGGVWKDSGVTVRETNAGKTAEFTVRPQTDRLRIAAQDIIDTKDHKVWIDKMAALDFVNLSEIGSSIEGRAIYHLEEADAPGLNKPYVVVVGRQHPPETTGAESLMPFVETIWGDSALARQFRSEFNLIVVPLINPDGVANGHWRHNMGGLDLNRDWGPFTQPETRAVQGALQRFETGGDKVVLFLDFHSTKRNLIYTQTDTMPQTLPLFTRDWIANVKAIVPDEAYSFTREPSSTSSSPVSKNYMYNTHSIPALTFEVGDETPKEAIEMSAKVFADEMMKLLLDRAVSP